MARYPQGATRRPTEILLTGREIDLCVVSTEIVVELVFVGEITQK